MMLSYGLSIQRVQSFLFVFTRFFKKLTVPESPVRFSVLKFPVAIKCTNSIYPIASVQFDNSSGGKSDFSCHSPIFFKWVRAHPFKGFEKFLPCNCGMFFPIVKDATFTSKNDFLFGFLLHQPDHPNCQRSQNQFRDVRSLCRWCNGHR